MGLERKVFFIGSVPEATLPDVYNLGDMFSLVSERGLGKGEGVPLTPLEAAACGKPIVVGNEDGSQEAVIDGENGRIISPRDPAAMRDAIATILLDDENRRRMGLAARARIEAEFSYEGFRNKTGRLLDDLMKRGHRTRGRKDWLRKQTRENSTQSPNRTSVNSRSSM